MTKSTTITINGRLYDAITGMPLPNMTQQTVAPVRATQTAPVHPQQAQPVRTFSDIGPARQQAAPVHAAPAAHQPVHPATTHTHHVNRTPAQAVHQRTQKSETLYRKALKKPAVEQRQPAATQERNPLINHFHRAVVEPTPPTPPQSPADDDLPQATKMHPMVAKVLQQQAEAHRPELSSKELKEQLIRERLAQVGETHTKKANFWARQPRLATVLASTLSLLILGGYLTFINLPNISMKVAATRAGINASFPNYKPDGYNLNGPITYSPGQVSVSYKSNTNDNNFKLTQKASNWDSQAVLDNYVSKQTSNYLTFQDHGLTIYTFDNKAAWANGGMLYTVDGTANLSSDQILRLATSM